jgi:predicted Abi (CAAX) family protease
MVIIELDAEHRVREGLDDLALQLDLFFLWHPVDAIGLVRRGGPARFARVP